MISELGDGLPDLGWFLFFNHLKDECQARFYSYQHPVGSTGNPSIGARIDEVMSQKPDFGSEVKIQSCVWRILGAPTVFLSTPGVGRSYWGHAQGSERVGTRQSEIAQGWLAFLVRRREWWDCFTTSALTKPCGAGSSTVIVLHTVCIFSLFGTILLYLEHVFEITNTTIVVSVM